MTEAVGPLVVSGPVWGLPDGRRGVLDAPAVVVAAGLAAETVLVVGGDPRPGQEAGALWPAGFVVEATGTSDVTGRGAWRYRVEVPGVRRPVHVVLVERDGGQWAGPWQGLTGTEACTALRVLESHGVRWSHSTSRTAEQLVLSTHPRHRGGRRLETAATVPGPAASARLEDSWQAWSRTLTEAEAGRAWVHTFDANAAYLGCWQTAELGFGEPTHVSDPVLITPRLLTLPGVWRVELAPGWAEAPGLPAIAPGLVAGDGGARTGWVMTPTLGRLRQWAELSGQGEVVPVEGWAWPERSRFLRGAGERLRDVRAVARQTARDAGAALLVAGEAEAADVLSRLAAAGAVTDAVRDLYTITTGRLGTTGEHAAGPWRRPDWGNTIRATWRTNLHRRLVEWTGAGAAVFAVATDAVAIATDTADPIELAEAIGLRLGDGLGSWKVQGTAPLADVAGLAGGGRRAVGGIFDRAARS